MLKLFEMRAVLNYFAANRVFIGAKKLITLLTAKRFFILLPSHLNSAVGQ